MATNQTGIAIVIKAWLPAGKTLDEQFEALSIVKQAHETGDYSALLASSSVEEVKTEQKTRRMEKPEDVPTQENADQHTAGDPDAGSGESDTGDISGADRLTDAA